MSVNSKKKRFGWFHWGVFLSVIAAIGITAAYFMVAHLEFGGMLDVIYGFVLTSQIVSGVGYVTRPFDIKHEDKIVPQQYSYGSESPQDKKERKKRLAEFIGLIIGLVFSISATIIILIMRHGSKCLPFFSIASHLPVIGLVVFSVQNISNISGLFSRSGRVIDTFRNTSTWSALFKQERINYALAIIVGIIIGAALSGTMLGLGMLSCGVLPAIFFVVSTISVCASGAGYVGRVFDFFLGNRTIFGDPAEVKDTFDERMNDEDSMQNILTFVGLLIALAVAATLVATGGFALPFLGLGHGVAGIAFTFATSLSSIGIFNRIGEAIDRKRMQKNNQQNNDDDLEISANAEPVEGDFDKGPQPPVSPILSYTEICRQTTLGRYNEDKVETLINTLSNDFNHYIKDNAINLTELLTKKEGLFSEQNSINCRGRARHPRYDMSCAGNSPVAVY